MDGANGLRFSARKKGGFTPGTGSPFSGTFATSASESLLRIPKADINPNKAVFTIDSKSSRILIVNNNACQLLGYTPRELGEMQFTSLLSNKNNKNHVSALAEGQLNSEDGTMVLLSGKVVEMNTKCGSKVAVSLWIRQIDMDGHRCLAVAEPVERRVAQLIVDRNGFIVSSDVEALMLFQIEGEDQFIGAEIQSFIPAIQLPDANSSVIGKSIRKQKATGKTSDGIAFPLCLMITAQEDPGMDSNSTDSGVSNTNLYVITIWVFQNISGLLVIDDTGLIESCNHHFSMLMFGYAQAKILRLHITRLIPNFGQEFEYLGYTRSRNVTTSSLDDNEESETETDPVYYEGDQSLYTTPAAMTTSEYCNLSSSIKTPVDLSKAISEPVKICSDSFQAAVADDSITNKIDKRCEIEQSSQSIKNLSKSASDSFQMAENCENNQNAANCQNVCNVACDKNVKGQTQKFHQSEESSTNDATELLTPVNEGDAQSKYLLASDTTATSKPGDKSTSATSSTSGQLLKTADISEALREIESDSSQDISMIRSANTSTCDKKDANIYPPVTSTPDVRRTSGQLPANASACSLHQTHYNDGKYKGQAVHSDGNVIDILYTISSQELPCGRKVYCVWVCRDVSHYDDVDDDEDDGKHLNLTLTFNSVNSTVETSVSGQPLKYSMNTTGAAGGSSIGACSGAMAINASSRPNSLSLLSQCEDEQISGDYSKYYTTLKQIGKGAFGYVKMAFRHSDRLLVVTKFILKEKLTPQFMVLREDKKEIPMEVYLLSMVEHPNIVNVLDVFENEKFFQLVMEKHGSGMDLFEFIDRRPMMDEQLGCYIFRQIANAIDYLHSLNILHRDIKDENIIIDQHFHVKLIDFGSATFMEEGKLFATFYGTTEYCSPEVLAGNKYAGPELEVWSLGVTLFVLMFFENPFLDIEETLVSVYLMKVRPCVCECVCVNSSGFCKKKKILVYSVVSRTNNAAFGEQ